MGRLGTCESSINSLASSYRPRNQSELEAVDLWEGTLLSFSIGFSSILGVGGGKEEVEFSQEPRELLTPPTSLPRHDGVLCRPGHVEAGDL